jgi:hypothetical protein
VPVNCSLAKSMSNIVGGCATFSARRRSPPASVRLTDYADWDPGRDARSAFAPVRVTARELVLNGDASLDRMLRRCHQR